MRLNDDSLWVKRVIYTCMYMYVLFMLDPSASADHLLDILCMHICVYISISLTTFFSLVNVSEEAQCHVDYPGPSCSGNFLPGSDSSESLSPSPQRDDLVPLSGVDK